MNTIHCLIVDDEPLARDLLQTYLSELPNWVVVKTCINAVEAYGALHESTIDVMFLDIQMPIINGIDFLKSLKRPPLVVFTTAHPQHAVDGFALEAVDYLLKPITKDRFLQAVSRLTIKLGQASGNMPKPTSGADHIFIKQDARSVKVRFDDILFAEAQRDFTYLFSKQGKMLASMHLKLLEDMLPTERFLRIHRSYLINVSAITAIQGNIVEIEKHQIPIGSSYKEKLLEVLGM